jgi:hypothetical protein
MGSWEKKKARHYSDHFTISTPADHHIPAFPKVTLTGDTWAHLARRLRKEATMTLN